MAYFPLPNLAPIPSMKQRALKNVNNCMNTNLYSYLETSVGQSYKIYLNFVGVDYKFVAA